jgi:hypothetical protein
MRDESISPYAPIRLRSSPWWRWMENSWLIDPEGRVDPSFVPRITSEVLRPMIEQLTPRVSSGCTIVDSEMSSRAASLSASILELHHWVEITQHFKHCGQVIFDLDEEAVTALLKPIDIHNLNFDELLSSSHTFFVRLGKHDALRIDDSPLYVDGIFVSRAPWWGSWNAARDQPDWLRFAITTVDEEGRSPSLSPGFFADLLPSEQLLAVPEAITAALNRRKKEVRARNDLIASAQQPESAVMDCWQEVVEQSMKILERCAPLIVNTLPQLRQPQLSARIMVPGRDTPEALARAVMTARTGRRVQLRKQMIEEGYPYVVPVHASDLVVDAMHTAT